MDDWETLTDPILLAIFSYLDVQNLSAAARTCTNWWRISLDESLWKALAFQRVGCRYACHDDVTWKSELIRLIYYAPVHLHQTCVEHHDEIYYICFSNSGNLIATCGEDGIVNNWCRVSLDESLWKALTFRRVGCRYACRDDVTWKSELKRLIYHAPVHLHQTCQEHQSAINYICFSNSGNLIATCGEDRIVTVWKYGNEIQLLISRQIVDKPYHVNYVEFNQAETHLITHCITWGNFMPLEGIIMVLSIHTGALCPVAAMNSVLVPFRGTWLANDTFLHADNLEDFPDDIQLIACKLFSNASEYTLLDDLIAEKNVETKTVLHINQLDSDLEYAKLIDWSQWNGGASNDSDDHSETEEKVPILEYTSLNNLIVKGNVETKTVLHVNQLDSDLEYAKVIDWSQWNGGASNDSDVHSETNEKVLILYFNNLSQTNESELKFYRVDLDSTDPVMSEPIRTIKMKCLGLQLSADHRYLVCNTRRITVEEDDLRVEEDVITMVICLENTESTPEIYGENQPMEIDTLSTDFFPHVSPYYVAAESDRDVIFLWDRTSRQTISKLSHRLPDQTNGVSAVAFHPRDQEVLVTVADDCKLRVWKSGNRLNSIATGTMS